MRSLSRVLRLAGTAGLLLLLFALPAHAEPIPLPNLGIKPATSPVEGAQTVQILLMLTVLSVAPAVLVLTTAFTRIVVVLGFLRTAIGTNQLPPNQVLVGLALFLTVAIMAPTFQAINTDALQPYMRGEIQQEEALAKAGEPLKRFMIPFTRKDDLALMLEVSGTGPVEREEDTPFLVLVPAFAISELRTAFTMGFLLFLPFLIIDLITASTMMSMGMMMVPPTLVSLPFKILLFVLVDGWHLVVQSLVESFRV